MGFDGKYGKVTTEYGDIPDDEPVIVFRARDLQLVPALDAYVALCAAAGSPQRHLNLVQETRERVRAWQQEHKDRTRVPDSERSREWLDK